jgi:prevent-host-death family protein
MIQVTVDDAKEQLSNLVDAAMRGEGVIIVTEGVAGKQLIRLTLMGQQQARKAGSAKGRITIHDDFDDPLPDFDEYQ